MSKDFRKDLYQFRSGSDRMLEAGFPSEPKAGADGSITFEVPLRLMGSDQEAEHSVHVRLSCCDAFGVRVQVLPAGSDPAGHGTSPMVESLPAQPALTLESSDSGGYRMLDPLGTLRAALHPVAPVAHPWSDLLPATPDKFELVLYPDGKTEVPFASQDHFFPAKVDALALGQCLAEDGSIRSTGAALSLEPGEALAGTGERFARMNLSGQSMNLLNEDALGVNNTRAYKNVPWVLSSRGYGLFIHTSKEVSLSLGDHSTRSLQVALPGDQLDLFILGGGTPERVIYHYRQLTGFPGPVPRWSYGIWMSRMTYFSADEVQEVAKQLRSEDYPCDVLHIDTGWFAKDWICEWEFGETFPDPEGLMQSLLEDGYRVSLWQNPNILKGCRWTDELREKELLGISEPGHRQVSDSDFSGWDIIGQIDFSNPAAVRWYREKLGNLLRMGAAAIKTDFGETIDMDARYHGMPAEELRNLYALLYQKAASEETMAVQGHGMIWARAGWAGCQRYPVHWGGDCACSWDGMAGSLRGGLHLGLSGFGYWSHDVPGFHGIPDFMNSRPSELLYLRWTQFGTFSSHFRYHGTSEREPWHYPGICDQIRAWWRLRYALIPYIEQECSVLAGTGRPFLAALCLEDPAEPTAWQVDDQFMAGRDVLVAPVMNETGIRHVWLPEGEWIDFWDGTPCKGRQWLYDVGHAPATCPVFVRKGVCLPVYPDPVASTNEMKDSRIVHLEFGDGYKGLFDSLLGPLVQPLKETD